MTNYEEQKTKVAEAIAEFPETFGIKNHGLADTSNRTFRISRVHSYVDNYGAIQLYTEILKNGEWLSFAKATPQELKGLIVSASVS